MKRMILGMAVAVSISGCATAPVAPNQAAEVPAARIYNSEYLVSPAGGNSSQLVFVRDSGAYGIGVTIHLFLDGKEIAGFRPSEKLVLNLPAGEYLLGVKSVPNFGVEQFIETAVRVEPPKRYAFRIGIDYNKAIVQRTSAF